MTETFLAIATGGFFLTLVAALTLVILGAHVVKRHPAEYDPARNAKRYTRPALALVILIAVGILAFFVGLVEVIVSLFT